MIRQDVAIALIESVIQMYDSWIDAVGDSSFTLNTASWHPSLSKNMLRESLINSSSSISNVFISFSLLNGSIICSQSGILHPLFVLNCLLSLQHEVCHRRLKLKSMQFQIVIKMIRAAITSRFPLAFTCPPHQFLSRTQGTSHHASDFARMINQNVR